MYCPSYAPGCERRLWLLIDVHSHCPFRHPANEMFPVVLPSRASSLTIISIFCSLRRNFLPLPPLPVRRSPRFHASVIPRTCCALPSLILQGYSSPVPISLTPGMACFLLPSLFSSRPHGWCLQVSNRSSPFHYCHRTLEGNGCQYWFSFRPFSLFGNDVEDSTGFKNAYKLRASSLNLCELVSHYEGCVESKNQCVDRTCHHRPCDTLAADRRKLNNILPAVIICEKDHES